jgi:hypothetical protein
MLEMLGKPLVRRRGRDLTFNLKERVTVCRPFSAAEPAFAFFGI